MSKESIALICIVFTLSAVGIVMVYSASAIYAYEVLGSSTYFLIRQTFFFLFGVAVMFFFSSIDPLVLRKHSRLIIFLTILFLAVVYIPFIGHTTRGTKRWLHIFGINIQPSEVSKIAVCIYVSDYLSRNLKRIAKGRLSAFIPPVIVVGLIGLLIVLQPDLGTVVILMAVVAVLFFVSGLRQRYIWFFVSVFIVGTYFAIIKVPYRMRRISAYLDPWRDPLGSGFQIIQSFLALAGGGLFGVGLGKSTQKLFYLPQSYTDFIFSIIGEELGFIGAGFVVLLFLFYFVVGVRIASKQLDPFKRFLALSITLLIVIQAMINIFVATGLLPTKGLPLPFISYGGSSLVVNMAAVGILLGIDRQRYR